MITGAPSEAEKLFRSARRRRWLTALVHSVAGACFAATMTAAFLSAGKMDFSPFRFAFLTWINIWPALMAIDLIVGPSRRSRLFGLLGYFAMGAAIATVVLVKNPGLPIGQLLYLWLDINAIPTLLLLIFLNRRIRAVGPLLLVFMILGVAGATLTTSFVGNNPKLLKAVSEFSFSIGLGATGMMIGLHVIGFAACAIVGWLILELLRQLYESKGSASNRSTSTPCGCFSASSIPLAWCLKVTGGSPAVSSRLRSINSSPPVCFSLFGVSRRANRNGQRLLLLRVFALGQRSEQALRHPRQILAQRRQHPNDRRTGPGDHDHRAP